MIDMMIVFRSAMTRSGEMALGNETALPAKPRGRDWVVIEPVQPESYAAPQRPASAAR